MADDCCFYAQGQLHLWKARKESPGEEFTCEGILSGAGSVWALIWALDMLNVCITSSNSKGYF